MIYGFLDYIRWHYSRAFVEGFRVWLNIEWFFFHFFSIPVLFHTFFDRFERMGDNHVKGSGPSEWLATLFVNTMMRLVGMFLRFFVILAGLFAMLIISVLGALVFVFWVVLPLAIIVLLLYGINFLLK